MQDAMIGRTVLGRYRVVRALAKGGMGVVYLARSEGASGFTKPVVVKRMASDLMVDRTMARMFVREARLMSRLRHPSIVGVIDFGEERGDYLMVIDYVHGYHLGQWNRFLKKVHGPFPADLVIHIVIKILDALHYAHGLRGDDGELLHLVHRDVSPGNILVDVEGQVKLADFGVARSTDQTEQTEQSTIKGKMPYLAPELFRLEDPSPSSDAYACAVVLHELLVGRNEFRAKDVATTVSRVLEHTPTPIGKIRKDLPPGLGSLVHKALAKEPEKRFSTAAELAAALREVRPGTEEEMNARLKEDLRRDFHDPRMAELIGFSSLAEREEAWKNPPILSERPPRPSSSPPTMGAGSIDELIEAKPARSPIPWIVAGLLGLAVIAAGAFVLVKQQDGGDQPQAFVVVTGTDSGAGVASGPADTGAADTGEPTAIDSGSDGVDTGATGETSGQSPSAGMRPTMHAPDASDLQRAFRAHRGEVVACFRSNPTHAPESGQVTVVVSLNDNGSVAGVNLQPASVASTPLGACVTRIARSTRFPGLGRPVRFSIPVRVTAQ